MDKLKILYVEDDEGTREIMQLQFKREFSDVLAAGDGKEALEIYNKDKPDVVITDLSMPVMSGFEMIEIIRSMDKDIPIIVISAYREEAENLDVQGVMVKPVLYTDITDCLADMFGLKKDSD